MCELYWVQLAWAWPRCMHCGWYDSKESAVAHGNFMITESGFILFPVMAGPVCDIPCLRFRRSDDGWRLE